MENPSVKVISWAIGGIMLVNTAGVAIAGENDDSPTQTRYVLVNSSAATLSSDYVMTSPLGDYSQVYDHDSAEKRLRVSTLPTIR